MDYFKLCDIGEDGDLEKDYVIVTDIVISKPKRLEEWDLDGEFPLSKWSSENYARYAGSKSLNDLLVSTQSTKIISERFANLLPELKDQVSIYPINLRHEKTRSKTIPGYFIMVVNHVCDCIDLQRTPHRIDYDEVQLTNWKAPLVLLKNKIPAKVKIFRTAKMPSAIILRSDLLKKLKDQKVSGVRVTAVEISGR